MGLDYDYFMGLTPYLWNCKHKGYSDKKKRETELLAWQTALLMNATGNMKETVTVDTLLQPEKKEEKVLSGSKSLVDSAKWVAT